MYRIVANRLEVIILFIPFPRTSMPKAILGLSDIAMVQSIKPSPPSANRTDKRTVFIHWRKGGTRLILVQIYNYHDEDRGN